jgi:hypothetical protein
MVEMSPHEMDGMVRTMIQRIAELEGRVAALSAYITFTGNFVKDDDVRTIQGNAQGLV